MGILPMGGVLHDDFTVAHEFLDGDLDFFRFDPKQGCRIPTQERQRQETMTALGSLAQAIAGTGLKPHRRVPLNSNTGSDPIGQEKTDAVNVAREAVRIFLDSRDGLGTIGTINLKRQ